MDLVEKKPLICKKCGGVIDRFTMKCPFCDTQYERLRGEEPSYYPVVERRGVERLCVSIAIDECLLARDTDPRDHITRNVLVSLARRLLDYATITVMDDHRSFRKIINAMIEVVPPRKEYDNG